MQQGLENASFEQKRQLVELLIDWVVVSHESVEIRYVIPTSPNGEQSHFCRLCIDYFYEGENMLVIHPDECIDCGVCEPECPAEAIKPDTEPGQETWLLIGTEFSEKWPNITIAREAAPDADSFDSQPGKFEKYFSRNPGQGD